jgi:hypothetical protein
VVIQAPPRLPRRQPAVAIDRRAIMTRSFAADAPRSPSFCEGSSPGADADSPTTTASRPRASSQCRGAIIGSVRAMATRPPDDRWATHRVVRIVLGREGEAAGGGEAAGVHGRDGIDDQGGGGEQAVGGALGGSPEARFALGEGQRDRVDVRRGSRQEEEPATDGLDGRVGVRTLVGTRRLSSTTTWPGPRLGARTRSA